MASTDRDRVIVLGQRLGVDEVLGKFDAQKRLTELRLSRPYLLTPTRPTRVVGQTARRSGAHDPLCLL